MPRYRSTDEDSARWAKLSLRDDDIVVSTRSKHGTTWVQTILLMLVHGGPDLPAPLPVLSPWLDHLVEPVDDVVARLDAQEHRRVIKTHTPLDGIPDHPAVDYVVVARDPLDAAVSLFHQSANIDRSRRAELTGNPESAQGPERDVAEWLADWIRVERDPVASPDSLQGVLHHLSDAWRRRRQENVHLVHFADLERDLEGEIRRLAVALDLPAPEDLAGIVAAAGFDAMRARADDLVPDAAGILRDRRGFFRRGRSGAGRQALGDDDLATHHARVAALVDTELAAWLHR